MPKSQQKTKPKNVKKKDSRDKVESKPTGITSRKSYWVGLSIFMTAFGAFYGYYLKVSPPAIIMLLASVLSVIGFGFYMNFSTSSVSLGRRAMFVIGGTSLIGFGVWAATVLSLGAGGLITLIDNRIGNSFFAITSLIICLAAGAIIGDQLGKKEETIQASMHRLKSKIFRRIGED